MGVCIRVYVQRIYDMRVSYNIIVRRTFIVSRTMREFSAMRANSLCTRIRVRPTNDNKQQQQLCSFAVVVTLFHAIDKTFIVDLFSDAVDPFDPVALDRFRVFLPRVEVFLSILKSAVSSHRVA